MRVDPFANPKEIDIIAPTTDGQEKARLGIYRIDKGRVFIATDPRPKKLEWMIRQAKSVAGK